MIQNLDFLNKNIFRSYPIRQGATKTTDNGLVLPNFVISAISLSIPAVTSAIDYQPYISQVAITNSVISVNVSVNQVFNSSVVTTQVGVFQGIITKDFQTFNLISEDGISSGFLITGQADAILKTNGVYLFHSPLQTGLEISTYIVFNPPGVSSLQYREKVLTGNINFGSLVNINESNVSNACTFSVIDNSGILSLADKSSEFNNCDTPVITNINSVVPYPVAGFGDDSNIYLFGVEPIVFTNDTTNAAINVSTTNLNLTSFCTLNGSVLAPVNPNFLVNRPSDSFVGINNYYSKSQTPIVNFLYELNPEFLSWPYFVTTYSLVVPSPSNSTYTVINPTTINGTINKIYAITDQGTVTFTVKVSSTSITGLTGLVSSNNGLVVLATGANTFVTTDSINVTITATSGTPHSFQLIVFYTQLFS